MKKIFISIILFVSIFMSNSMPAFAEYDDYPSSSYVDGIFDK